MRLQQSAIADQCDQRLPPLGIRDERGIEVCPFGRTNDYFVVGIAKTEAFRDEATDLGAQCVGRVPNLRRKIGVFPDERDGRSWKLNVYTGTADVGGRIGRPRRPSRRG